MPEHTISYTTSEGTVIGFSCSCGEAYTAPVMPSTLTRQTLVDKKISEHASGQYGPSAD